MTQTPAQIETLEAALPLFLRYGYRKTSMDELARAAGISRQGLYLRFPNKKALFIALVDHLCAGVEGELKRAFSAQPPDLVGAFDAYMGTFVASGFSPATADEMMEQALQLRGEPIRALQNAFGAQLTACLEPSATPEHSAADLAGILMAAAHGFKHSSESRADYRARMGAAISLATRAAAKA